MFQKKHLINVLAPRLPSLRRFFLLYIKKKEAVTMTETLSVLQKCNMVNIDDRREDLPIPIILT